VGLGMIGYRLNKEAKPRAKNAY